MSFSTTIPTLGIVNNGGLLAIGVTGTTTVMVTGAEVLTATGLLGLTYLFSKYNPKMANKLPFSWTTQQEGIKIWWRCETCC